MKFKESLLAKKYCTGKGIELGGAAHNPFNLDNCINVAPNDRQDFWAESQIQMCEEFTPIDLYGTAESIPVEDNSFDYILSSHVIEHVSNPIKAFLEWNRVIKDNGIIFTIFPKRNADPSDGDRPISDLQEFINQYKNPQPLTDDKLHIWIWTLQLMIDLIEWCNKNVGINWKMLETLETDDKVGNGHLIVCQKIKPVLIGDLFWDNIPI